MLLSIVVDFVIIITPMVLFSSLHRCILIDFPSEMHGANAKRVHIVDRSG